MHLHSCNIFNHIMLLEKESCKAQGYQEFSLKSYKNWYFNGLAGKRSQYSFPYCGSTTTECLVPLGARSRRKDIQVIPNDRDKLTKMVAIGHRQNVMSLVSDVPSLPAAKQPGKSFTAWRPRWLSAEMLDFSPCLGFQGRKAAASRRQRMD